MKAITGQDAVKLASALGAVGPPSPAMDTVRGHQREESSAQPAKLDDIGPTRVQQNDTHVTRMTATAKLQPPVDTRERMAATVIPRFRDSLIERIREPARHTETLTSHTIDLRETDMVEGPRPERAGSGQNVTVTARADGSLEITVGDVGLVIPQGKVEIHASGTTISVRGTKTD